MEHEGRAGRYEPQPQGYSAFIPTALPPDPPVHLNGDMLTLVSRADRSLGRLDGSIQTLPDPDLFVSMYMRKEAVFSSQIEGTQSSLDDLLEEEAQIDDPGRPPDVKEVQNYVEAMKYGLGVLREGSISTDVICRIHERLLEGSRGGSRERGRLRKVQNWIGPKGAAISDATFVPPPPGMVQECLDDLVAFLGGGNGLPVLIRIGLAHAQFETVHPFHDGNGRMGRLLIAFLLCETDILEKPVLYISHHLSVNRSAYYGSLQGIRDAGDWESWLQFFLGAVGEAADSATKTARNIVDLRERHRRTIAEQFGRATANGLKVLESLYSSPIETVNGVVEITGLSFTAASNLMNRFVEHGILVQMPGRSRNRRFRYGEYIGLFF
jgi:Fic family protein